MSVVIGQSGHISFTTLNTQSKKRVHRVFSHFIVLNVMFFNMYLSKNDRLVSCLTLDCERAFTNEYHILLRGIIRSTT